MEEEDELKPIIAHLEVMGSYNQPNPSGLKLEEGPFFFRKFGEVFPVESEKL